MKRLLLVATVALIMAAMMAVNAMPAFAAGEGTGVPAGGQGDETLFGRQIAGL